MPGPLTSAAALIFSIFILPVLGQSLDPSKYPASGAIATARDEWTQAIASSVPNTPARPENTQSDWSKDVTRCTGSANQWAMTFDDGPSPYTDSVVNALRERNAKGTFFVVGSRIAENPSALKRAYEAGHQIAIHTWSHPYLTTLTTGQIVAEIVYTAMAIKEIIGVTPKSFRPPYGDIDDRVRAIAKALDLDVIIWNADVNDFEFSTASSTNTGAVTTIVSRINQIAQGAKQGTISLQHDLFAVPSQAGAQVIPIITNAGFSLQTVAECTGFTAYSESLWSKLRIPAPQPLNSTTNSKVANSSITSTNALSSNAQQTNNTGSGTSLTPVQNPNSGASALPIGFSTLAGIFVSLIGWML